MIRLRVVHRYIREDGNHVYDSTQYWDNFLRDCYRNTEREKRVDGWVQEALDEWDAIWHHREDGENDWLEFKRDEDATMFLLRWS